MDGIARFPKPPAASPRLGGSPFIASTTGYPWADGDILYAADLNAAVAAGGVSVLEFGAAGDGVTDDTAAIQAALNATAGKGVVFIPETGHPYIVGALQLPTGTDLLLHGTLKARTNGGDVLEIINGVHDITVRGHGTVDCNGTNQTGPQAGVYLFQATNVRVSDITIKDSFNWNVNVVQSSHILFDHVSMLNSYNSNEFAAGSDDCWFMSCLVDGVNDAGLTFYGNVTNSGAIGNVVRNVGYATSTSPCTGISVISDGAQPNPAFDIVIADNIIHHCTSGGIYCDGGAQRHNGITISGNRCHNNGLGISSGPFTLSDIGVNNAYNVTVIGNSSSNFGAANVTAQGLFAGAAAVAVSFIGNHVRNVGQATTTGVGLAIGANYLMAHDNWFYNSPDNPGGTTMQYSIQGYAGTNNSFTGNRCGQPLSITTFQPDTVCANVIAGAWVVQGNNYSASRDQASGLWSFVDSGNINFKIQTDGEIFARAHVNAGGVFIVGGTQVVGPRIPAWGTPTSPSRIANFPGASATLVQTSETLAALIVDLKTHGLLGA